METQITKPEAKGLAVPQGFWGAEKVDSTDLIIPRIVLAQGNSDLINSGKAAPGDLIDSVNTGVLAKKGEFLEFVPFKLSKLYQKSVKNPQSGKFEKIFSEPFKMEHIALVTTKRLEQGQDGREYKNESILICSCVLPQCLSGFPFLISFRSTSYFTGKKLANHFKECQTNGTAVASTAFKLSTKQQSGKGNTWWVLEISKSRASKPEEMQAAYKWYQEFSAKPVEMSEPHDDEETVPF